MKELEFKLTEEALKALFEGKKIVFDYAGQPRVTLYPPRYGVFMTYEKMAEVERLAQNKALEALLKVFRDVKEDNTHKTN